jgi:hypothetical protein
MEKAFVQRVPDDVTFGCADPQETTLLNGPTNVIPYSLYWTTNHESSEGNFSGPDHLDFFESASRDPVERLVQLENSVRKLQWPLIKSHPVTVPAGSFVRPPL